MFLLASSTRRLAAPIHAWSKPCWRAALTRAPQPRAARGGPVHSIRCCTAPEKADSAAQHLRERS